MLLDKVQGSPSLELVNLVLEMKAQGREVTSLAIGDPSFDTPAEIIEVAHKSMLAGETHYVFSYGTRDVRDAIVRKVARKNGIRATQANTMFISTKMAVYVSLAAVSSTSFEALIPDPGYFYSEPVTLAGGEPVYYRLRDDYTLDIDAIKKRITPKTKALILNTPANPTGKVLGEKELRELYDVCASSSVRVISDEAYEDLVYGRRHFSIGSLERDHPEWVVSLYSLSKSYSMTGWRAGYIVGATQIVDLMNKFVENAFTCFPPFIQHAAAYALDNGDAFIADFLRQYIKRRDLLQGIMREVPGLDATEIEGAFYAFPRYGPKVQSRTLCKDLLQREKVALLPGSAFGPSGEGHLRISFSPSEETIERAMSGVKRFFASLG